MQTLARAANRSVLWFFTLLFWIAPAAPAAATDPWLAGPFAAQAAALRAAADALPQAPQAPAEMLFEDAVFMVDGQGRLSFRRHWVYRILNDAGLADWSVSQVRFSPWHQERPRVRVRVIDLNGFERSIDETSFRERAAPEGREELTGERRLLEAALPGAVVGSLIEESIEIRDRTPYWGGGTALRHYATLYVPLRHGRLTLSAPKALPLRYGARLLPGIEPQRRIEDDLVKLSFEYRDVPAASVVEVGIPAHRPRFPHVAFSTGSDWQSVASSFHQAVEKALAEQDFSRFVRPDASLGRDQRIAAVLADLRAKVRSNGLELGAGPPWPVALPAERLVGDGKDLAMLCVGLLRRAGIDAQVALINAGFGPDVEPRLPGIGMFNHAIVFVPGSEPLFIDPSASFARPGSLPLPEQGRFALVIGAETDRLILTPVSRPEDNRTEETREITFADYGYGRVVEKQKHFGSIELNQRQLSATLDTAARRRVYQAYVQAQHLASTLGAVRESASDDFSAPFHFDLEAIASRRVRSDLHLAELDIPWAELTRRLPAVLQAATLEPRKEEFIFHEPFSVRWTYRVSLPTAFEALDLPADRVVQIGPGRLEARFRKLDGSVEAELGFNVGQRLLSAAQFDAMRLAVLEIQKEPEIKLRFVHRSQRALEEGRVGEALADLRAGMQSEPQRASQRLRLAQALLRVGLTGEAQRQAREATRLAPSWALASWILGLTLEYDELGRRYSSEADLSAAAAAFEKAIKLGGDDERSKDELVRLTQQRNRFKIADGSALHPDDPMTPFQLLERAFAAEDRETAIAQLDPRTFEILGFAIFDRLRELVGKNESSAIKVNGAPYSGYRLKLAGNRHVYVGRSGDGLKIVAGDADPARLGLEAVRLIEAAEPEAARRWLDWAFEDLTSRDPQIPSDPLARPPFLDLWSADLPEEVAGTDLRRAAAALAAPLDRSGKVLVWLNPDEIKADKGQKKSEIISGALARARLDALAAAGRLGELDELTAAWLERAPASAWALEKRADALRRLGDWDQLLTIAERRLAERPDDANAARLVVEHAAQVGAPERGLQALERLAAANRLESADLESWIFAAIAEGSKEEARFVALADKAAAAPESSRLLVWRAVLAFEMGEAEAGRELFLRALALRPFGRSLPDDAFVVGRLAEHYGFLDLARDHYARLPAPTGSSPFSLARLGRKRLAALSE